MFASHILVTGASSGIGRGLALTLAKPGIVLHLGGRNEERFTAVSDACRQRGAQVFPHLQDVTDREGMEAWVRRAGEPRLDLVLACAGITGAADAQDQEGAAFESSEQVRRMLAVNLDGAMNTVLPALDIMRAQSRDAHGKRGRICAIASVAGLVSYPGTPSYSASKAALDRFMVASGAYARPAGIVLSSVCCGFVDTPMVAQNRFPMPGLASTQRAVREILHGVAREKRRIIFPRWLVLGSRLMDVLPIRLAEAYYLRQPSGQPGSMAPIHRES
ncbi:SDR family NAD(P)-dependent oxidoreductase [Kozakia baliensis]|uniref:Dehydrogenase n=1 Tax=Kozakia baliensis TaxID=153496 RepID=A0A1D8UQL9_9PROT|nr:SDR family NAD(P)-dependent oxidoreductase [Kozakia baliensis]AOX15837.1 dehydrogenase [Kozakia baliensis]GEL65292.1 short-chain dehydrogenase [Kozakia baliensis]